MAGQFKPFLLFWIFVSTLSLNSLVAIADEDESLLSDRNFREPATLEPPQYEDSQNSFTLDSNDFSSLELPIEENYK
jgi:hypothetical protein